MDGQRAADRRDGQLSLEHADPALPRIAECYRILDIDLDVNPVPFEVFRSRVHPEDYPALEQDLTEAISTKSPFTHEYRVVHRDGKTLHVVAVGQFDEGPTGDLELEGIITDVSQRKAAEQALADVLNELARATGLTSLLASSPARSFTTSISR